MSMSSGSQVPQFDSYSLILLHYCNLCTQLIIRILCNIAVQSVNTASRPRLTGNISTTSAFSGDMVNCVQILHIPVLVILNSINQHGAIQAVEVLLSTAQSAAPDLDIRNINLDTAPTRVTVHPTLSWDGSQPRLKICHFAEICTEQDRVMSA